MTFEKHNILISYSFYELKYNSLKRIQLNLTLKLEILELS